MIYLWANWSGVHGECVAWSARCLKAAQIPAADPGLEDQAQQLPRCIYGENELTASARFE